MASDRVLLAATFDRSAEFYDEIRPDYPEQLFDDLFALAGTPPGGCVLELGCGTGKATLSVARRGYRMLCLEPGANLAAVARRNLTPYANVELEVTSFEDWPVERAAFDLVMAATSFPWIDPAVRYTKTAEALRPDGCVAVFQHTNVSSAEDRGFWEAIQDAYQRYMPETAGIPPREDELPSGVSHGLLESGLFDPVAVRHYPDVEVYDTAGYLKLLQTFSGHLALPEDELAALLAELAELIERDFDGQVVKKRVTELHIARRR